jgi:hypothetical protein
MCEYLERRALEGNRAQGQRHGMSKLQWTCCGLEEENLSLQMKCKRNIYK